MVKHPDELRSLDRGELLTVYQVVLDEIERAKNWGTQLAYWTLAAQGGVLALATQQAPLPQPARAIFTLVLIAVTCHAAHLESNVAHSLGRARKRKETVLNRFPDFASVMDPEEPDQKPDWKLGPLVLSSGALFVWLVCVAR